MVAVCSPIGIFLGRISNFINSELYGIETNVPWSVKFIKIDDLNRHPSQIYEAIFEGVVLFIILSLLFNRLRNIPGIISGYFLILYGTSSIGLCVLWSLMGLCVFEKGKLQGRHERWYLG